MTSAREFVALGGGRQGWRRGRGGGIGVGGRGTRSEKGQRGERWKSRGRVKREERGNGWGMKIEKRGMGEENSRRMAE